MKPNERKAYREQRDAQKLADRVAWLQRHGVVRPDVVAVACFRQGMLPGHWHCRHGHLRDCPQPTACALVDKP